MREAPASEMAKAKKSKPREKLLRRQLSIITAIPAKVVEFTLAPEAETAERQVAEAHEPRRFAGAWSGKRRIR